MEPPEPEKFKEAVDELFGFFFGGTVLLWATWLVIRVAFNVFKDSFK